MDVIFRMFIISFLIEVQPLPPHRQRLPEGDEGYVHILLLKAESMPSLKKMLPGGNRIEKNTAGP